MLYFTFKKDNLKNAYENVILAEFRFKLCLVFRTVLFMLQQQYKVLYYLINNLYKTGTRSGRYS